MGIEHIENLAQLSIQNLNKSYSQEIKDKKIKIVVGDGRLGYEPEAPYDVINVGAGSSKDIPAPLMNQLKVGGKLIMPIGPDGN